MGLMKKNGFSFQGGVRRVQYKRGLVKDENISGRSPYREKDPGYKEKEFIKEIQFREERRGDLEGGEEDFQRGYRGKSFVSPGGALEEMGGPFSSPKDGEKLSSR